MTFPNQDACVINYVGCGFWSNPLVMECDLFWRCWNVTVFFYDCLRNDSVKVFSIDTFPIVCCENVCNIRLKIFHWGCAGELRPRVMGFQSNKLRSWDISESWARLVKTKTKKNWFFLFVNKRKIRCFWLLWSHTFTHTHTRTRTHTHAHTRTHTHTHARGHVHTHAHHHTRTHAHTSKLKIGRHYWLFFLILLLPVLFVWCNLTFFFRNDGWSKPDFSLIMPLYRYS